MNKNKKYAASGKFASLWKKGAIALMASTLVFGSYSQALASSAPLQISQRQQEWDSVLSFARLMNARQEVTSLILQLDVLDKPETSYANAVYQIFARRDGRWSLIYSSTGARLITNSGGRVTLEPEVISLDDLQDALDDDDLEDMELRAVAQLRYDVRGGQRNQQVTLEQVQRYEAIAQTTTTQIASSQTNSTQVTNSQTTSSQTTQTTRPTVTQTTQQTVTATQTSAPVAITGAGQPNNTQNPLRGHFSLAVLQSQPTLENVIVRVSLKSQRPNAFLQERFVGDFRYRVNQRARFIRGLNPGDRVVVRLFTPQNVLIGYSEFELLDNNAAVNLILPSQRDAYGTVHTVYGIDSDENGSIDANRNTYSYFTQVTGSTYRDSRVTFLSSTRNINTSLFQTQSVSSSTTSAYSSAFESGTFSLIGRTIPCFVSGLAPALTAVPGEVVEITNVSSSISTYEVSQLILVYQEVGFTEGTIVRIDDYDEYDDDYEYDDDDDDDDDDDESDDESEYDDDDDDDDDNRSRRQNCNQGIGNGAEGCDPGNSRPHGGSNDETGRTPGGRGRR